MEIKNTGSRMKIEALRHVIRASAGVTGYKKFLILGSQAILGHCLDKDYDFSFHESMELDSVVKLCLPTKICI